VGVVLLEALTVDVELTLGLADGEEESEEVEVEEDDEEPVDVRDIDTEEDADEEADRDCDGAEETLPLALADAETLTEGLEVADRVDELEAVGVVVLLEELEESTLVEGVTEGITEVLGLIVGVAEAVGELEVSLHPEHVALEGCVLRGKHSLTLRLGRGTLHHTHPASRSHALQSE